MTFLYCIIFYIFFLLLQMFYDLIYRREWNWFYKIFIVVIIIYISLV